MEAHVYNAEVLLRLYSVASSAHEFQFRHTLLLDSKILLRRLRNTILVLAHFLPMLALIILLEELHVLAVHLTRDLVRLPLLEREPGPGVRVILGVRLVLVVLDADEVAVNRGGVERERDERVDGGRFDTAGECPRL